MRKLILMMQTTLDGYVTGPHGEMDWFDATAKDQWAELFALLRSVDTIVMGRGMYPEYADYWSAALVTPDSPKDEVRYARLAEKLPHIVFSSRLKSARWGNTQIERGALEPKMRALKRRRGKSILALGGAKFAASLLDAGLVDDLQLIVNPCLLGGGKSLFERMERRQEFELNRTKNFTGGAVLLRYSLIK